MLFMGGVSSAMVLMTVQANQYAEAQNYKKKIHSWGSGNQGQLGLGQEGKSVSKATSIDELEDVPMKQIDAFHEKSAAITEDGQLIVWGRTKDGSMVDGQGHTFKTNLVVPTVFEEASGKTFKQVSCGKDHVAAVTDDGKVITMGNSSHGKLGFKLPERDRTKDGYQPSTISSKSLVGTVELDDIK